jgi:signal peptidase I
MVERSPISHPQDSAAGEQPRRESVKDTIESVVVAFILAFVFRAFIVEAFVIPTGSMAATLDGEHWPHVCSECGLSYDVGANHDREGRLAEPGSLTCPNCNWARDVVPEGSAPDAGDRILVLKWPLDFMPLAPGALGPARWDVTVFKNPSDGTTNYIKRLVGLPGEVIEIIDGDLYAARLEELPPETIDLLHQARRLKKLITDAALAGETRAPSTEDYAALAHRISQQITPYLRILRKTPEAQQAVWSVVYDHDHLPRGDRRGHADGSAPLWASTGPNKGWESKGRRLTFDGLNRPRREIRLARKNIVDLYGYNTSLPAKSSRNGSELLPVGDVRLSVVFEPFTLPADSGDSEVELVVTKRRDTFRARIAADGMAWLLHRTAGDRGPLDELCATLVDPLEPGRAHELELRNVDYRVTLLVDGEEVLQTTDEMYSPDINALRKLSSSIRRQTTPVASVALAAAHLQGEFRHVCVERDIHYRCPMFTDGGGRTDPLGRANPWYHEPCWGAAGNPLMLGPGEYMMLGDNSPQSQDSRLWWKVGPHLQSREDYQLGTVPGDQIIGRAFFVYWPAGYRAWWTLNRGVIPNAGRWRWIK